jgi:hypothetical protein
VPDGLVVSRPFRRAPVPRPARAAQELSRELGVTIQAIQKMVAAGQH